MGHGTGSGINRETPSTETVSQLRLTVGDRNTMNRQRYTIKARYKNEYGIEHDMFFRTRDEFGNYTDQMTRTGNNLIGMAEFDGYESVARRRRR